MPSNGLSKTIGYGVGGWYAEIHVEDDDGRSHVGYWYGTREACEALDPETVTLHSKPDVESGCGDAATRTGMYDGW